MHNSPTFGGVTGREKSAAQPILRSQSKFTMKTSIISVGDHDYNVAVQRSVANKKAPILVYVNQEGNETMGCYIYTIASARDCYQSVLQGLENGDLHDFTANMGRVLVKRYGCPLYVSLSGGISIYDYGELSRAVVEKVEGASE